MTLIIILAALFVGFGLAKRANEHVRHAVEELCSYGGTDSDDDQTERTA